MSLRLPPVSLRGVNFTKRNFPCKKMFIPYFTLYKGISIQILNSIFPFSLLHSPSICFLSRIFPLKHCVDIQHLHLTWCVLLDDGDQFLGHKRAHKKGTTVHERTAQWTVWKSVESFGGPSETGFMIISFRKRCFSPRKPTQMLTVSTWSSLASLP